MNTINKLNAGLISKYSAVKEVNPDLNEEQIQQELERISVDQKEKAKTAQSELFGNVNYNEDEGDFEGVNGQEQSGISEETGA